MVAAAVASMAERLGETEDKIKQRNVQWASAVIKKGVIIELHIGRTRFERKMTKEDLGIDIPDAEFQKFMREYYDLGRKLLIPKRILTKLDSRESKARNNLYQWSYNTPWGHFVPYTAYAKWKEVNEKCREQYLQDANDLVANIGQLKDEIVQQYRAAASKLYERTQKNKPIEQWTEEFIKNIENQVPTAKEILESIHYSEDLYYVPLPTELEEDLLRAEVLRKEAAIQKAQTQAEQDKIRMEVQMHRDTVARILDTKKEKIESLFDTVSEKLKGEIYVTLRDVLKSIKSNTSVTTAHEKKLRAMVERIRVMNFVDIPEIEESLRTIEQNIDEKTGGKSLKDVVTSLHDVATAFQVSALTEENDLPDVRDFGLLI